MAVTVKGLLVPVVLNPGSKSEHQGFEVATPEGTRVVVQKRNDHPFQHRELRPFANHQVRVVGVMFRGRLIADEVEQLD